MVLPSGHGQQLCPRPEEARAPGLMCSWGYGDKTNGDGKGEAIRLAAVLPGSQGGPRLEAGGGRGVPWSGWGGGWGLTSPLLEILRIHQDHTIWRKGKELSRHSQSDLSNS